MKSGKCHTLGTISKIQSKNRRNSSTIGTHMYTHLCSLSCFGTDTSVKNGGVKLVLLAQAFPLVK